MESAPPSRPSDDECIITAFDESTPDVLHAIGVVGSTAITLIVVRNVGHDGLDLIALPHLGRAFMGRSEHYIAPSALATELGLSDQWLARAISVFLGAIQRQRQIQKATAYVEANKIAKAGKS